VTVPSSLILWITATLASFSPMVRFATPAPRLCTRCGLSANRTHREADLEARETDAAVSRSFTSALDKNQ
jgi:hypothetical protein